MTEKGYSSLKEMVCLQSDIYICSYIATYITTTIRSFMQYVIKSVGSVLKVATSCM